MHVQLYFTKTKHLNNNERTFEIDVRIMRVTTNINLCDSKIDVAALVEFLIFDQGFGFTLFFKTQVLQALVKFLLLTP